MIRDPTKTTQREEPAAILDRDPVALAAQQHLEELLTVRPWPTAEIRRSSTDLGCNLTRV